MLARSLTYAATAAVIVVVGVSVHSLAGLDWPWAIVIGAGVSVALRWLVQGVRKRPLAGRG
jgi:hypothetical protein